MNPIIARLPWDTLIRHSSLRFFFFFYFSFFILGHDSHLSYVFILCMMLLSEWTFGFLLSFMGYTKS